MKQVLHTQDIESDEYETPTVSSLKPDELIQCKFPTTPTEDGQCIVLTLYIIFEKLKIALIEFVLTSHTQIR